MLEEMKAAAQNGKSDCRGQCRDFNISGDYLPRGLCIKRVSCSGTGSAPGSATHDGTPVIGGAPRYDKYEITLSPRSASRYPAIGRRGLDVDLGASFSGAAPKNCGRLPPRRNRGYYCG